MHGPSNEFWTDSGLQYGTYLMLRFFFLFSCRRLTCSVTVSFSVLHLENACYIYMHVYKIKHLYMFIQMSDSVSTDLWLLPDTFVTHKHFTAEMKVCTENRVWTYCTTNSTHFFNLMDCAEQCRSHKCADYLKQYLFPLCLLWEAIFWNGGWVKKWLWLHYEMSLWSFKAEIPRDLSSVFLMNWIVPYQMHCEP